MYDINFVRFFNMLEPTPVDVYAFIGPDSDIHKDAIETIVFNLGLYTIIDLKLGLERFIHV